MTPIDDTHDPTRTSWVDAANTPDCDFPIQNLPFGRFMLPGDTAWRLGVAIGDQVLDLAVLGCDAPTDMRELLTASASSRVTLRHQLVKGLTQGAARTRWQASLYPIRGVTLGLPCEIGDYTDFYAGIHHAMAVGKLFRPDAPLLPNYRWVPIAYHGRASTIMPSGQRFTRPQGQVKLPDPHPPVLMPTARLDFELEMGILIGRPNPHGQPIALENAEDHVFGLTLLNDWSARDIQAWEYQPLGPFLAKNFATTLSPWVVTLEALAPFRAPLKREADSPPCLPYLDSPENLAAGSFNIALDVWLETPGIRREGRGPERISHARFAQAAYWTVAQMVAHHTVNGCLMRPGDLLGTGTLSGPAPEEAGSLLELTQGGAHPIRLQNGEERRFLEDGDTVTFKARAEREGFKTIGFGECVGGSR